MMMPLKSPNKSELKRLYAQGKTLKEIGTELKVSGPTVSKWLREMGIKKRTMSETFKLRRRK